MMTREEWKNYREFDLMSLEMNGGAARLYAVPAATDALPKEISSARERKGPELIG